MVVVARSVPAGAAAEAMAGRACAPRRGLSRHGRRLLLRQALLDGDEVDAGHGGVPRRWWLRLPTVAAGGRT